jgi:hypothetical protein
MELSIASLLVGFGLEGLVVRLAMALPELLLIQVLTPAATKTCSIKSINR